MEKRARRIAEIPPLAAADRRDPKVRRQLSGPAMRTFLNIADTWKLTGDEQRALLGWPPESTFYKYKAGQVATLPYDIRYSEPSLADSWVRLPNTNPAAGPGEFLPSINDDVSRRESSAVKPRPHSLHFRQ